AHGALSSERRSQSQIEPSRLARRIGEADHLTERCEPDAAANTRMPAARRVVADEHASGVRQTEHAEVTSHEQLDRTERQVQLRTAKHRRVAREPVRLEAAE